MYVCVYMYACMYVYALTCPCVHIICILDCRRGTLLSTAIFLYATTSPINGYFGGALYSRLGGKYLHIVAYLLCYVYLLSK